MRNPWIDQHMQAEMDFTGDGYTRRAAAALVRGEFAGHEEPEDNCGLCGAPSFYRPTVGAVQCPSCRAVRVPVWVHKVTGAVRRGSSIPGSIADQYRLDYEWAD